MAYEGKLITISELTTRLNLEGAPVENWVRDGCIPRQTNTRSFRRYPAEYASELLAFTKNNPPTRKQALLYTLAWIDKHDAEPARKQAIATIKEMYRKKQVIKIREAIKIFGRSHGVINHWIHMGFLPAVKIGGEYYIPTDEIRKAETVLKLWTPHDVASRLQVTYTLVTWMIREGKLEATKTPCGLRISEEEVSRVERERTELAEQLEDGLAPKEACQMLGITKSALIDWANSGILEFTWVNGQRVFSQASIERVDASRKRLNQAFAWLPSRTLSRTYSSRQAGRRIGIRNGSVNNWGNKGLLPFFDASPPEKQGSNRFYIAAYIDMLVAYAASHPVSMRTAEEFMQRCREAGGFVKRADP